MNIDTEPQTEPTQRRALVTAALVALGILVLGNLAFIASPLPDRINRERRHLALPLMLREHKGPADIAVIGDSRVIHGVRPELIEDALRSEAELDLEVVNLGLSGAPPVAMLGFSGRLLERGTPKVVVLMLSHYMFSTAQDPQNAREPILATMGPSDMPAAIRAGLPMEDAAELVTAQAFEVLRVRRRLLGLLFDGKALGRPAAIGDDGWEPSARVDAREQRRRAESRAGATRDVLDPARGKIDETQFRYLEAAISRLEEAGAKVILVEAPTASALWPYFNGHNLYAPIEARIEAVAAKHDISWIGYRENLKVEDHYFSDGDHFAPEGALRFSSKLTYSAILPALGVDPGPRVRWTAAQPSEGCEVLFDFEALDPTQGFTVQGDAFTEAGLGKTKTLAVTGAQGAQSDIEGMVGLQLVNTATAASADRAQGTAISPSIPLSRPTLKLRVGGGHFPKTARVELRVGAEVVLWATGSRSERLETVTWDVSPWLGQEARLAIVDQETGPWGHVLVDQVEHCEAITKP
jgi:hypothetical protein